MSYGKYKVLAYCLNCYLTAYKAAPKKENSTLRLPLSLPVLVSINQIVQLHYPRSRQNTSIKGTARLRHVRNKLLLLWVSSCCCEITWCWSWWRRQPYCRHLCEGMN